MENKTNTHYRKAVAASLLVASIGSAQESHSWFNLRANDDNPAPVNRFGLSYRAGFNASARFRNGAGLVQGNDPGPAVAGVNHNYDDGYNRVDNTGNNHGGTIATWNWGYENASQVNGTSDIFMHSTSATAESSTEVEGDTQMGFELNYHRQFGRLGKGLWGMEGAFSYTDLSIRDSDPQGRPGTLITDRYDLAGVTAPEPPYAGSFEGPGVLIGDDPTRSQSPATASGFRKLSANVYGLRLGPYFQFPVAKRLSLSAGAGFALAVVQSDFKFEETVFPTVGAAVLRKGKDSADEVLPGAYVMANVSYAFSDRWNAFAGVQYQYLGNYHQTVSDKEARVDLGKSIFLTVGVGFSF